MRSKVTAPDGSKWLALSMVAMLLGGPFLAACALPVPAGASPTAIEILANATPIPGATPTLPPFTPEPAPNPGVVDLLKDPPPAGQSVEVDAYFNGAGVPAMPGGGPPPADRVACPQTWNVTLTDRPYLPILNYLNGTGGRPLPEDAAWLAAATPEQTRPGARTWAQLPYHARLRGHLGDPAFTEAGCVHAERIFVVEQVVKVYQQDLPDPTIYQLKVPADYATWPRHADARFGYSLPYPPDWQAERLDDVTLALAGPQWPGNPLMVRVHEGEVHYDQYDPASASPLLQGQGWGVFRQGGSPYDGAGSQGLDGYRVDHESTAAPQQSASVLFSAHGYTFELALTYPTGFGASQELLNIATAIVQGFRLDELPAPSPTPPVKQQLGRGPFLSQEQALAAAEQRAGGKLALLSARLAAEAESRHLSGPCDTYTGHPDGVWLLVVRGTFEGQERTMRLYLDAANGEQLCGEEVSAVEPEPPATEPAAGTQAPAATATPYPTGRTAPTPAPTLAPRDQRAGEVTQVTLDVFSGRPNPAWPLLLDQDRALRGLLDPLPTVPCRPLDLPLGYRGFVVLLGQRPELSNEYRLRVYDGQVRYGDPWSPQAPATCRADPGRQIERFLLETGRSQLDPALLASLAQEMGLDRGTPSDTAGGATPTPTRRAESTSAAGSRAYLEGKAYQVLAYEGTADTYVLTNEKLVGLPYMIYWGLQTVDPEPYVGKTIQVEKFLVRNHPLDRWTPSGKFVTPAPAAGQTHVFVFVVEGQAVGGTAFPPAAEGMAGGYWSLDGKTLEEVHGVQDFQAWRVAWVARFGGTVRPTAQVPIRSTAPAPATWTPAPAGSALATAYPTPTPAPFPGDFRLTLFGVPMEGSAPLVVRLQASLTGGPDNSYELYCAAQNWEFGDGQDMSVMPDCGPWTPEVRNPRSFQTEHTYERPGTYQVRLLVGNAPFGLSSNVVTIEVR